MKAKPRLGTKIKTVDDLLCQDNIAWVIDALNKERANLAGIVVIKVDNKGIAQILTTYDGNGTLSTLTRAMFNYALQERQGQLDEIEDDDE